MSGLQEFASFGPYSELGQPTVSIVNPTSIHVGAFVKIGAYAVLEALVPERGVTLRIEDGAYIGNFPRITAVGEVVIGEEAMLSDRVYVSDTGHIYEDVTQPIKRDGLRDGRRVEIWCLGGHPRSSATSASARTPWSPPTPWSVRTCPTSPWWPATPPASQHDGDAWQWLAPRGPA